MLFVALLLAGPPLLAKPLPPVQDIVRSEVKLSATSVMPVPLSSADQFGRSVAMLGDVDGDGVGDLAVGAHGDDDGSAPGTEDDIGAVWIVFLQSDGTPRAMQKISATAGGFSGQLDVGEGFGRAVAGIGDLDGDGVPDLAVGADRDDDGATDAGAVWILRLLADGSVKSHSKISASSGGFAAELDVGDNFGRAIAPLGDLDENGVVDLAVAATNDDDGGFDRGAFHVLFMNADGSVLTSQKVSELSGGFGGRLHDGSVFGMSLANAGDVDGDGVSDLAVGSIGNRSGGPQSGAVWVLMMNPDGSVKSESKLDATTPGGFGDEIDALDELGFGVAGLGDYDGDGVPDIAAGAIGDDDGGGARGAVYVLCLASDGSLTDYAKLSSTRGGFGGDLQDKDWWGSSVAGLGDLDGDGVVDLAAGARFHDDGAPGAGAVYLVFLERSTSAIQSYGCGINPEGSLVHLGGTPGLGNLLSFGIDNPLGTQAAGSKASLFVSLEPDPAYPCGSLIPNWGMTQAGTGGELLISIASPNPVVALRGDEWTGPGVPSEVSLLIPNSLILSGLTLYMQAVLNDPVASTGVGIALTGALEVRIP